MDRAPNAVGNWEKPLSYEKWKRPATANGGKDGEGSENVRRSFGSVLRGRSW